MLRIIIVAGLIFSAQTLFAACEYCGGSGMNRTCKQVTEENPNGHTDCIQNYTGQCTQGPNGTTCRRADCPPGSGECELDYRSDLGLPPVSEGELLFLDDAPICRSQGLTIEA